MGLGLSLKHFAKSKSYTVFAKNSLHFEIRACVYFTILHLFPTVLQSLKGKDYYIT